MAALPFRAISTTAQDRLLEQALDGAGKRHSTVLTAVETPHIGEDRVMLYRLHGCVTRPDTLVLIRKDHALLHRRLQTNLSGLLPVRHPAAALPSLQTGRPALRDDFPRGDGQCRGTPAPGLRGPVPRLVTAGVPAVVAMQDLVPIDLAHTPAGDF